MRRFAPLLPPIMSSFPIIDLSATPGARLCPVPLDAVTLQDNFWRPRREVNANQTLVSQFEQMRQTGRLANFRRAAGHEEGDFEGMIFNDSDLYKWLEAASSALAEDNRQLTPLVDEAISLIVAAQCEDGYLHTYYTLHPEKSRWENPIDQHQLYCLGHFIQAAIAHHRATGADVLLDVARRVADCIDRDFGLASQGKIEEADGHEEIEMALVELYRATHEERYLKLAQFFIDVRGRTAGREYHQNHVPFRDLNRVTGHAVRALYYACGATDLALETGEAALWKALDAQWRNFTTRQMYVSGGAGSRWEGESFGFDWELPNQRACTETCAAIAVVMWAFRAGQHQGEARYFDVLERALYNGVISGLSLAGDDYFYQNPLADDGHHRRKKWFGCACCPPNIARLLAQLPGYFYSVSDEGVWAHLFAQGEAHLQLKDGQNVVIEQQTGYPSAGEVRFVVKQAPETEWTLRIRVPEWATGAKLEGDGETRMVEAGEYVAIRRAWKAGEVVSLVLRMDVRLVGAHPYAVENGGRVAVTRGPLLYCAEATDNPGFDFRDASLSLDASFTTESRPELLNGATILRAQGHVASPARDALYAPADTPTHGESRAVDLTLIPYYAWANREAGQMQVWLRAD